MMNGFGWGPGFGWIFMILFWGLVIMGVAAIARSVLEGRSWKTEPRDRTALDILKERYARERSTARSSSKSATICSRSLWK